MNELRRGKNIIFIKKFEKKYLEPLLVSGCFYGHDDQSEDHDTQASSEKTVSELMVPDSLFSLFSNCRFLHIDGLLLFTQKRLMNEFDKAHTLNCQLINRFFLLRVFSRG